MVRGLLTVAPNEEGAALRELPKQRSCAMACSGSRNISTHNTTTLNYQQKRSSIMYLWVKLHLITSHDHARNEGSMAIMILLLHRHHDPSSLHVVPHQSITQAKPEQRNSISDHSLSCRLSPAAQYRSRISRNISSKHYHSARGEKLTAEKGWRVAKASRNHCARRPRRCVPRLSAGGAN